jgi:hypothetical protein
MVDGSLYLSIFKEGYISTLICPVGQMVYVHIGVTLYFCDRLFTFNPRELSDVNLRAIAVINYFLNFLVRRRLRLGTESPRRWKVYRPPHPKLRLIGYAQVLHEQELAAPEENAIAMYLGDK